MKLYAKKRERKGITKSEGRKEGELFQVEWYNNDDNNNEH